MLSFSRSGLVIASFQSFWVSASSLSLLTSWWTSFEFCSICLILLHFHLLSVISINGPYSGNEWKYSRSDHCSDQRRGKSLSSRSSPSLSSQNEENVLLSDLPVVVELDVDDAHFAFSLRHYVCILGEWHGAPARWTADILQWFLRWFMCQRRCLYLRCWIVSEWLRCALFTLRSISNEDGRRGRWYGVFRRRLWYDILTMIYTFIHRVHWNYRGVVAYNSPMILMVTSPSRICRVSFKNSFTLFIDSVCWLIVIPMIPIWPEMYEGDDEQALLGADGHDEAYFDGISPSIYCPF